MSQPKTGVQELFDGLAAEYRQERDKQLSFLAQKRIVLEMLSGLGGRLLEVGCGPAPMVDELLARNFAEKITHRIALYAFAAARLEVLYPAKSLREAISKTFSAAC